MLDDSHKPMNEILHMWVPRQAATAPSSRFIDQVHTMADVDHQGGYPLPISITCGYAVRTTYRTGALWAEEYHQMTEVMLDGSDGLRQTTI